MMRRILTVVTAAAGSMKDENVFSGTGEILIERIAREGTIGVSLGA